MSRLRPADATFGIEAAGAVLIQAMTNQVQDLGLLVESVESVPPPGAPKDWQPGAILRLPYSSKIRGDGDAVSEQALMSLADTAMTIACAAAWQGYWPTTSIDQTPRFLHPVRCDVLADARVLRMTRGTCFGHVNVLTAWNRHIVGTVEITYAID